MRRYVSLLAVLSLTAIAFAGTAQSPPPAQFSNASNLPEWDRLTPAQRDLLLAPVRDRWNRNPDARARMYDHAQRWHDMTPEQRASARRGMRHFDRMDPRQRERSRALFDKMQSMPPEQRKALREQWKAMSPDQRDQWLRNNAPVDSPRNGP